MGIKSTQIENKNLRITQTVVLRGFEVATFSIEKGKVDRLNYYVKLCYTFTTILGSL